MCIAENVLLHAASTEPMPWEALRCLKTAMALLQGMQQVARQLARDVAGVLAQLIAHLLAVVQVCMWHHACMCVCWCVVVGLCHWCHANAAHNTHTANRHTLLAMPHAALPPNAALYTTIRVFKNHLATTHSAWFGHSCSALTLAVKRPRPPAPAHGLVQPCPMLAPPPPTRVRCCSALRRCVDCRPVACSMCCWCSAAMRSSRLGGWGGGRWARFGRCFASCTR